MPNKLFVNALIDTIILLQQGRNFIFGGLGYLKLGAPFAGLRRLMSYKSALHVLATFTKPVVPIHKHITFF